ncbi:MAG: hypothetical protein J3K34DRAFT_450014, partial [Monoraphidium minutum]
MVHRAPAPREPAEAGSGGVKHGGRRALPVCQHAPLDALDHVLHDVGCLKLLPAPAPLAPQPPRRLEHCEAQVRPALLGVRARLGARLRRVWAPRRRAVLQPHLRSERRRAAAREPRPQVCQPAQRGPHRRAVQQRVQQRLKRPAAGRRRAAGGVAAAHCVGEARLPRAPERRLRPAAAERRVQQHPREAAQLARQEPVAARAAKRRATAGAARRPPAARRRSRRSPARSARRPPRPAPPQPPPSLRRARRAPKGGRAAARGPSTPRGKSAPARRRAPPAAGGRARRPPRRAAARAPWPRTP